MTRNAYIATKILMTLGLITISPGWAKAATQEQVSIVAAAQSIVDYYSEPGWFSGSVLLAKGGQPIYEESRGMANREAVTANNQDTKYNLGSIMKDYTAVLVLQQIENGTLSLDDKLATFDLGFAADMASRISIGHLLNHRSGLTDVFTAEYRQNPLAFKTISEKLELLKNEPLLFEPGSERRYSNYGYIVLGAILEKVTGKPFETLLQENIFNRLKLEHSVYPYKTESSDQSLRYTFNYAGDQVFVGVTEHHGPDGGIESTAADVLTFYRALFYSDKLLSRKHDTTREYFAIDGEHWRAYGGGSGVSAAVELDLENDYQIIVLANTDQLVAEEISGRIYSYIQSGSYDPFRLPPHVYAWNQYQEMGEDAFKSDFVARYTSEGYNQFVGRSLNELGMSLLEAKKWDEAFNIFGALAELFPDAPQVYDSLAYGYWKSGDPEKAKQTFEKALSLQPDFSSDYSSDNYGILGL